jgi:uncharacterized oligopeptide transporter (OPT) family protein
MLVYDSLAIMTGLPIIAWFAVGWCAIITLSFAQNRHIEPSQRRRVLIAGPIIAVASLLSVLMATVTEGWRG